MIIPSRSLFRTTGHGTDSINTGCAGKNQQPKALWLNCQGLGQRHSVHPRMLISFHHLDQMSDAIPTQAECLSNMRRWNIWTSHGLSGLTCFLDKGGSQTDLDNLETSACPTSCFLFLDSSQSLLTRFELVVVSAFSRYSASEILDNGALVSHWTEGFRVIASPSEILTDATMQSPTRLSVCTVLNKLLCTSRMEGLTDGLSFVLIFAC